MTEPWDVVVAGAGPVGLAFASSLADSGRRIALVDPQPAGGLAEPEDDSREIALTDRSAAILRVSGAWPLIPASSIAPLRRMRVLNGPSDYAMHFGGAGESLGRFAPNHWLRRALYQVASRWPNVAIVPDASIATVRTSGELASVTLSNGTALRARLVVAADTRRSRLRASQGIGAAMHDYRQHMLVCPMAHPEPHGETATAWFEYGRTLVTLPLNDGRSSAVMTLPAADAERLLRLDDASFGAAASRLYRGRLGPMRPVGRRRAVPVVTAYDGARLQCRPARPGCARARDPVGRRPGRPVGARTLRV